MFAQVGRNLTEQDLYPFEISWIFSSFADPWQGGYYLMEMGNEDSSQEQLELQTEFWPG